MVRRVYLRISFVLGLMVLLSCNPQEHETYYYPSGQISQQFEVENGKRNGNAVGYYENGKIESKGVFEDGVADGPFSYYYENGATKIQGEFRKGLKWGLLKFFREDGSLRRIEYYDESGNIYDFEVYHNEGLRDYSQKNKRALFVPQMDTLVKGNRYEFKIRLGNRQFDRIEVKIGSTRDEKTLLLPSLPNQDSLTAIFEITPEQLGDTLISGVVLDLVGLAEKVDVITFLHPFYVIEKERQQ